MLEKNCSVLLVFIYSYAPDSSQPTITRRLGMTNATDLRWQWSTAGLLDVALVRTTVTK